MTKFRKADQPYYDLDDKSPGSQPENSARLDVKFDSPRNPSLLIAMPQLLDPNFRRAVVLIMEHTPDGAFGLIINKISTVGLHTILAENEFLIPQNMPVWNGGPVVSPNGVILHNEQPLAGDTIIVPGVCLSSEKSFIKKYCEYYAASAKNPECLYPYRFFVGYAGWGAGQLDCEIRMGAWIQASVDKELIFAVNEENIWSMCLKAIGVNDENSLQSGQSPFLN